MSNSKFDAISMNLVSTALEQVTRIHASHTSRAILIAATIENGQHPSNYVKTQTAMYQRSAGIGARPRDIVRQIGLRGDSTRKLNSAAALISLRRGAVTYPL
ncbi:hypothetical protein EVAR_97916_1 [Eumeta japonica]|uniref:Uncharacterized protein n=1 Tax=Eumeta variegata TaxID=151549 RepID=A0A4C1SUH3_EUMVA|nr:hypothetical protein EVAR_97916_1 [Eumeta japonica]